MNSRIMLRASLLLVLVCCWPALSQGQAFDQSKSRNLLFETGFEKETWWKDWGLLDAPPRTSLSSEDDGLSFKPLRGRALRVQVDEGGHYGLSLSYNFEKRIGKEPEEIYFRYYLRLGNNWNPERGGKLPGIAGTYGRAGWGGRKVNGTDGWSARGLFGGQKNGKTPIGFYCYHADMPGKYGDNWYWKEDSFEGLENNRWYCIEQHVKLNTPKTNDGLLRAWVDGNLVFKKSDVRMRDTNALKIENIWINVYYGGSWTAQQDYDLYIDDIAIATSRIGK